MIISLLKLFFVTNLTNGVKQNLTFSSKATFLYSMKHRFLKFSSQSSSCIDKISSMGEIAKTDTLWVQFQLIILIDNWMEDMKGVK